MNKKLYSVSIEASGIHWADNYRIRASNKKEAKQLAIKVWQKEHRPKITAVFYD